MKNISFVIFFLTLCTSLYSQEKTLFVKINDSLSCNISLNTEDQSLRIVLYSKEEFLCNSSFNRNYISPKKKIRKFKVVSSGSHYLVIRFNGNQRYHFGYEKCILKKEPFFPPKEGMLRDSSEDP